MKDPKWNKNIRLPARRPRFIPRGTTTKRAVYRRVGILANDTNEPKYNHAFRLFREAGQ